MLSVTKDATEDAESNTDPLLDYPSLAGQLLFSPDPRTASSSWPALLAPAYQPSRDRQSPHRHSSSADTVALQTAEKGQTIFFYYFDESLNV